MDEGRIYVRVTGKTVPKKELKIHFQSRKQSGGGDISSIEHINDEEYIITFEDQEEAPPYAPRLGEARKAFFLLIRSAVARNVTLGTHTINGAQVEVSRHPFIGDNQNLPSNQSSFLFIRVLSKDTTEDALLNYFENTRRSGGGPVEEVKISGNSARVKFESSAVAKTVALRTHTINGTQVEVSSYPFNGDDPDLPSNKSSIVIVRGFSKDTTEDALLNYFENTRRSGGGQVEKVKFTENSARVKFESPEVANRVIQRGHILNGATLDVSIEISDNCKTIMVTGLASVTTKDSLWNYFENKRRSGGGVVESVDIQNENGVAFVSFEDASVVTTVLQREQHSLDGAFLTVVLRSNAAAGITDKEEMEESRTIEVTGLASTTTKDAITNFFENTRRSGGGEIDYVEIAPEKGLAFVTFLSAESAQGVLKKGLLTLDNAEIHVTLKKSAKKIPVDTKRLLVRGLSEETTLDALVSYMEVVSGLEVSDIEFGEQGCALILFAETYNYDTIKQKAAKRKLEEKVLSIEQVSVCHCVQVMGLNRENTTRDAIFYHFDNPKNGGGGVESVDLNINEASALVFFEDPRIVIKVMAKTHTLNEARLEVRLHNPVLHKPAYVLEDGVLEKEIPVEVQVMQFICERHEADLAHIQSKHGVKVTWEDGSKSITLAPVDRESMDEDRFEEASKAIASFVAEFRAYTTHVTPEAWQTLTEQFKETVSSIKDDVKIQYLNQQCKIVLTGILQQVEALVERLEQLKTDIESKLAVEASKVSTIVNDIPIKRLKFLGDLDFDKELEVKYEDTKVDICVDKGQVRILGPSEIVHKASADIWQAVANMKEVSCEMPQNAVEVLRRRPCQLFIQQQFTANNLQALMTFHADEEDEVSGTMSVIGMNSDVAQKALSLVKSIIIEESIVLDDGQVQLEKSEKWRSFRDELTANSILGIKFDQNSNKLCLAGRRENVTAALTSVKRFLNENTIVSEIVDLPRGCRRFLANYGERELRNLQDELNKYSTVIKTIAVNEEVVVTGTTDGVDKGMEMVYNLASKVESQKVPVNKPGMRKVLNRNNGRKMLALLENENKCVIEFFDEEKDASSKDITEEENDGKGIEKESECSFLTPQGKIIKVLKDNICDRNVDVIVNAANAKLQHVSGVSKAILDAGGEAIQHECDEFIIQQGSILEGQVVVTSAGKMPFKKIIHAVGPSWRKEATREKAMGKTPREEKYLRYAVSNTLDAARDFTSIALPAISTGAFEFPQDLCAKIMVDATVQFYDDNAGCRLSEIQFTSTDDAVVTAFVAEMASRFGQDPNFLHGSPRGKITSKETFNRKAKGRKKTAPKSSSASDDADGPNEVTTSEGIKVVLVVGNMAHEQVDAIVNSTSTDLDLSRNPSAKALSDAAGPSLQQECKVIGEVQTGGIVVTTGGKLKCKHVFHSSSSGWENGKGEQVLRDILKKSLHEAHKRSLTSIAIPSIGTGNLQFPHNRVAAASFEEVLAFSRKNPSSTMKEVHLVVYDKDLPTVQAFQTELQTRKRNQPQEATKSGKKKRRRSRVVAAKIFDADGTTGDVDAADDSVVVLDPQRPEIALGDVTVQAEIGDITKEVTDAIVTLSNTNLNIALNSGVGKAIVNAGGPSIQTECSALGVQSPGAIAVTGAGKLQTRMIYHMVPERLNMVSVKNCIINCLKAAESNGLSSISFPAVGTGHVRVGVKEAAQEMLAAIAKFAQEQPVSLHLIRIVIFQKHMFEEFRGAMEACISSSGTWTGMFSKLFGWFRSSKDSSPNLSYPTTTKKSCSEKAEAYLEVFAGTKQDVKRAVEEIHKYLADQFTTKVIEKDAISKLSEDQKRKIIKLEKTHDVTIKIEGPIGRISIRGYAEDVLDVATTIHEILNEKIEEEYCRGAEGLVCKTVQWYYSDDDDDGWEPYDPRTNYRIESAYGDGQDSVIFVIEDTRCEIVFRFMKETCLDDDEERNVVRKEIGKGIPLPDDWCVQPKDSSGKEKEFHLVQLDPTSNANEYNRVADEIRKSASINITKIERVQNPGLYRAYMVKKDQMEQKNGANEKFLFHGTAQGSCSSINRFGFNRSFCGKNATMFGSGVYFARDASYSTQQKYSPPDAYGNRYMYLAHVLVGEYAVGRQGMITPPAKGSDATDAYDSVVDNTGNPKIFVVFYDSQCYPDYLVTFK